MSAPLHHRQRMKESLIREISLTITNRMRDPRLAPVVTVTDLSLSEDMRNATVYVSILGDATKKESTLLALARGAAFIQKNIAGHIQTRQTPRLTFKSDDSLEKGDRIFKLLKEIENGPGPT